MVSCHACIMDSHPVNIFVIVYRLNENKGFQNGSI